MGKTLSITKKIFLMGRRIDSVFLWFAAAAMPLRVALQPIVLFCFSCIGIYLAAGRHRTIRMFNVPFIAFAMLYSLWSIILILLRGEPILDNRQIGYSLLITVFAFAGSGMVLVRDPLRIFVLGSRIAVFLAAIISLYLYVTKGSRVGINGNEAVFAYAMSVSAIAASFQIKNAPSTTPNSPLWLLLGILSVAASETRALLPLLCLFFIIEVALFLRAYSWKKQITIYSGAVLVLILIVYKGHIYDGALTRFNDLILYLQSINDPTSRADMSTQLRVEMWKGAIEVIKMNPWFGSGNYYKMDLVREAVQIQDLGSFLHVHNFLLDELLNHGIIGLFFLLAMLSSFFIYAWIALCSTNLRRVFMYFGMIFFSYAMFHNVMLHESTIAMTFMIFAVLNAHISRAKMRLKRA